jgi:hypothetical protein
MDEMDPNAGESQDGNECVDPQASYDPASNGTQQDSVGTLQVPDVTIVGHPTPNQPDMSNWTLTDHGYAYTPPGDGDPDVAGALGKEGATFLGENAAEYAQAAATGAEFTAGASGMLLTAPVTLMELETFPPDDPRANDPYGYCDENGNVIATTPDGSEWPPYQPDADGQPPPSHWQGESAGDSDSEGDSDGDVLDGRNGP